MLFWSIQMKWMWCEWSVHLSVDLGLLNARYHFFASFIRIFLNLILLLSLSCDEPFISLYSAVIFLLQCIVIYFRRSPSRLSRFSFFFIQIYFLLYMLCDPVMWNNLSVLSSVRFFFPVLLVYLIVCVVFFLYRRQKYS